MPAATSPQSASTVRVELTFPSGHRCHLYRPIARFYECIHGHVLRAGHHTSGGQR
ncbi:hypothetical protein BC739_001729 [Kutzneria viridogrisea]|uniref:Uncharacterized protein n=1 Tax=Kutzneria viridogrisea TaxID=47990 RepID=A0ABR6BCU5_9PSEU|nr:hypothetical protein [Kutzneria viridogrisea]